jgi:hypothetical protein
MQRYLREEGGAAQDWSSAVAMAFSGKGSPSPPLDISNSARYPFTHVEESYARMSRHCKPATTLSQQMAFTTIIT